MLAALETLFIPFTQGILRLPEGPALFIGARAHPLLGQANIHCIQPFYPWAAGLPDHSAHASYDMALALIAKSKEEAFGQMAQSLASLKEGGMLVVAAANDANGARLEKWLKEIGLNPQSLSKNKCRVAWAVKDKNISMPEEWAAYTQPQIIEMEGHEYWTQAGLFGFDKIDAGSKLLAEHLPDDLSGPAADFGCGYGYLSVQLLQKNSGIAVLDVIDADKRAIECAQKNCAGKAVIPLWADLTQKLDKQYDVIVMNPPFHEGKAQDAAIGLSFVRTAAGALKKGGQLYMVANRQLPYERTLAELFSSVRQLADQKGFKILHAVK